MLKPNKMKKSKLFQKAKTKTVLCPVSSVKVGYRVKRPAGSGLVNFGALPHYSTT